MLKHALQLVSLLLVIVLWNSTSAFTHSIPAQCADRDARSVFPAVR